jgi:hypothetical protein
MVRIVSTHQIVGDQRTPEMYGWFGANKEIGEPNKLPDTAQHALNRNAKRRAQRAKDREARSLERYLAKFSGEGGGRENAAG